MKFCTWGNIASALDGKTDGGGELQIAMLVKILARSGHEVTVIDYNVNEDYVTPDGVKVLHINGWNNGVRFLRIFTHRIPNLYRELKSQKADVYYCQIRDFRHIVAYQAARKTGGKFAIQLASNLDAMNFRMRLKHDYLTDIGGLWWFVRVIMTELYFPKLLRNADLVLVQHEGQKKMLEDKGIRSVVFNNLFDNRKVTLNGTLKRKCFCYVGALDRRKGFKEFYDLVNKVPDLHFEVIGQPRDKTGYLYFEKLKSFRNVTLHGKLGHSDTMRLISESLALVSTSPMEGFPNIFVEAWACGIPVLSLSFDPGSIIEKEKLGFVAHGNLDALADQLRLVREDKQFSEKAKAYVTNNHALTIEKIKEVNSIFLDLASSK